MQKRKMVYNDYISKDGIVFDKFWIDGGGYVLKKRKIQGKQVWLAVVCAMAVFWQCGTDAQAAEYSQTASADVLMQTQTGADASLFNGSVSDNSALTTMPDAGAADDAQTEENAGEDAEKNSSAGELEAIGEAGEVNAAEEIVQVVDSTQLQTLNYKDSILTDWQQINEALRTLSPDSLTNPDTDAKALVLQLQNVSDIPAGIKDSIISDDSGYTKYLHCNIGYGASLVFSGSSDNSGFNGVSNASVTVDSEKRGKKSMAVTVRFASHEDMGTVASLHVNLPQCTKGTKVSVYAETVSMDADGNVTVGENACIGNTKADENGNVEVLIQSTANYMFVYKAAKE